GTAALSFKYPPIAADAHELVLGIVYDDVSPSTSSSELSWAGPATEQETVDLAAILPRLLDASASVSTSAVVEWTAEGDLSTSDGATISLAWSIGNNAWTWSVVVPPNTTSPLELPVLPESLAGNRPPPGASPFNSHIVEFREASFFAGWDEYRNGW